MNAFLLAFYQGLQDHTRAEVINPSRQVTQEWETTSLILIVILAAAETGVACFFIGSYTRELFMETLLYYYRLINFVLGIISQYIFRRP